VWIDGGWVEAAGHASLTVQNPATLEPIDIVPECGAPEINRALHAARRALPGWRTLEPTVRAEHLRAAADSIEGAAAALAALATRETGTPLLESLDAVRIAAALFRKAAHRLQDFDRSTGPMLARSADGLRVVLPAAHYPLLDLSARVAAALAAGETLVCQSAPRAPLSSLALAGCLAALPPGVLNVITGGEATCGALIDHLEVGALTGPSVLAASRPALLIVPRDADLELAAAGIAAHRLFDGGQQPALCPIVLVEEPLASSFIERLHMALAFLEVGDPIKPVTDLGPLATAAAAAALESRVAHALKRGGKLILGARRFQPWGLTGHFFQPTLFTRGRPEPRDLEEQIAGPVVAVCPLESLAGALPDLLRARGAHLTIVGGDLERVLAPLAREAPQRLRRLAGEERLAGEAPWAADVTHNAGGGLHPLLERFAASVESQAQTPPSGQAALLIDIEQVTARAPWWFPYAERRPERA
jgi:acyl-CoA reductase-like NAD-dependent aldehyde dehydrogenase